MGNNDFTDMVGESIEDTQAEGGDAGEVDTSEAIEGAQAEVGGGDADSDSPPGLPDDVPAPQGWQAPKITEAEWTALQKRAALGQKYEPFAKDIDGLLSQGFRRNDPAAQAQAHRPAPKPPEDDGTSIFDDLNAFKTWSKAAAENPREYAKAHAANARKALKAELDEFAAHKQELAEIKRVLNDVYGETLLNRKKFAPTEEWKKYGEAAIKGVHEGKFNDFDTAWEHEVLKEKAAGATQKQAEAHADKVVGATPSAAARKGTISAAASTLASARKPSPADEASLRSGSAARRGGSIPAKPGDSGSNKKLNDKQLKSLVAESLAELGIR